MVRVIWVFVVAVFLALEEVDSTIISKHTQSAKEVTVTERALSDILVRCTIFKQA